MLSSPAIRILAKIDEAIARLHLVKAAVLEAEIKAVARNKVQKLKEAGNEVANIEAVVYELAHLIDSYVDMYRSEPSVQSSSPGDRNGG